MLQVRLEDLIIISCEQDIQVQHEDILMNFAQKKYYIS